MTSKKIPNEYDEIKGLLNKIRKIQSESHNYGMIGEQLDNTQAQTQEPVPAAPEKPNQQQRGETEREDIAVINDVDVEIHSEDTEDLALQDEEKIKISQLIDDFRNEVSEIVQFDKLHIYDNNAKIEGLIPDYNINFMLSTGNDKGLYLTNPSMVKIDDDTIEIINKLRTFEPKFINSINDLLVRRTTT